MNWQPVTDPHYAGPRLMLPARYANLFRLSPLEAAAQRSREETAAGHRPAHYVLDNSQNHAPTIIIATGPDRDWRPPADELKAMAEERVAEYTRSERAQSWTERQKVLMREYVEQIDRRWRALTGKTQFAT